MSWKRLFEYADPANAMQRQRELSRLVDENTPPGFEPRLICGLDAAYGKSYGVGVATIYDFEGRSVSEVQHSIVKVKVDYRPGLLGFREGPLLTSAAMKLHEQPTAFLVDGHGRAHPRRFGLACHVGLALDTPTIGVAKSSFYGTVCHGEIIDRDGTVLGRVLDSSRKRLYVSVGHEVELKDALEIVRLSLVDGQPAPLRAAHEESVRLKGELPH